MRGTVNPIVSVAAHRGCEAVVNPSPATSARASPSSPGSSPTVCPCSPGHDDIPPADLEEGPEDDEVLLTQDEVPLLGQWLLQSQMESRHIQTIDEESEVDTSGDIGIAQIAIAKRYAKLWYHKTCLHKDLLGPQLFRMALGMMVTPRRAMHPQRAWGGGKLLREISSGSLSSDTADTDNEAIEVVRRIFIDSLPRNSTEILEIKPIYQPVLLEKFLTKLTEEQATVELTWHGTRSEHVQSILKDGLDPSACETGAYGQGAYVGTHSGVAHQYADPDEDGYRHMCAMLVVVGNKIAQGHQGEQPEATCMDRLVNPTQYCLVDANRLYVSHLIKYRVVAAHKRRVGGGFEDPFQRALIGAIHRASVRRRMHGSR